MITTETTHQPLPAERRRVIGTVAALIATLGAIVAPAIVLSLLGQPAFASDFEMGTHDADYSSMPIAMAAAIIATASAFIGVVGGRGPGRTVCGFLLAPPVFVLLSGLLGAAF
ncbi:hypothetical protein [Williamsia sp. M5A3_1d]